MYSIVIPVYKNSGTIEMLIDALVTLEARLDSRLEVVFVVDGSPDDCWAKLSTQLPACSFRSQLLLHSRNFGSFAAIRSGLAAATGDFIAVMAADLQEPPELLADFFRLLKDDKADIVTGFREQRDDPFLTRVFSKIYWKFYKKYIIKDIPSGGVDVFGCNRKARDVLLSLPEAHSSLVAQLYWIGFRRLEIPYTRRKRPNGKSAWTFSKKFDYLLDSIFSFTDLPVRLLLLIGFLGLTTALIVGTTAFIGRISGLIAVSGYTALVITISFFGALTTLGIGIVGAYSQRTFENTKARPLAIVMRSDEFPGGTIK